MRCGVRCWGEGGDACGGGGVARAESGRAGLGRAVFGSLGQRLAARLEGLAETLGGGVGGLNAECGADVRGGDGQITLLQGQAREDEVGGGVRGELEGRFSFSVGGGGITGALTDLGEAGVAGGGGWVCVEGGLELLFSGREEALSEIVAAELGMLCGLLGGGQGGQTHGAYLVKLKGGLAEGWLRVGAAEARGGLEFSFFCSATGGDDGAKLCGFGIAGTELDGEIDFAESVCEVSAAKVGGGEVVVVVRVAGVCVGCAEEECEGIFTLAIKCDALIVDDLRQGQARGDEVEGGFGLGIFCAVEAGEAEVEVSFECEAISLRNLGEDGGGLVILAIGIKLLAEGERRCGVVWGFRDGGLEVLEALGCGGGICAADVVFKGAEADAGGGGEEGLLGYGEARVNVACDLPGDSVFDVEEAAQFGGIFKRRGEGEFRDFEDLRLDEDAGGGAGALHVVAADDDEVGVKRLCDAEGSGAGGAEVGGEAEMVEREEAIVMRDGEEAGGGEALIDGVGEGITDPAEVGLAGAIVKGEDEDDAAGGSLLGGSGGDGKGGGEQDQELLHKGDYRRSSGGTGCRLGTSWPGLAAG